MAEHSIAELNEHWDEFRAMDDQELADQIATLTASLGRLVGYKPIPRAEALLSEVSVRLRAKK